MATINELTNQINSILEVPNVKSAKVPKILISKAKNRKGLSTIVISSRIISELASMGYKIGTLVDGSRDMMGDMIRVIVEQIVYALQNDAKITISVDPGIKLQASGGNAGGPVESAGTTIEWGTGGAIIQ